MKRSIIPLILISLTCVSCSQGKKYNIEEYSLKDLDRYLWQLGKKYFLNRY